MADAARASRRDSAGELRRKVFTTKHVLALRDFETLMASTPNDSKVSGPKFEVPGAPTGTAFRLTVFPNGAGKKTAGVVSVYLEHAGTREGVHAAFSFTITFGIDGPGSSWIINLKINSSKATHFGPRRIPEQRNQPEIFRLVGWPDAVKHDQLAGRAGTLTITAEVKVYGELEVIDANAIRPVVVRWVHRFSDSRPRVNSVPNTLHPITV